MSRSREVKREFFSIETYSTYSALNELFGEETAKVARRAGEYAFAEVKRRLHVTETDPIALVRRLGRWLADMGYVTKIEIEESGENEFLYYMYGSASREGLHQIRREKGHDAIMPHYSTSLMFAALKEMCKMKAKITHLEPAKDIAKGASVERWVLSKIDENK